MFSNRRGLKTLMLKAIGLAGGFSISLIVLALPWRMRWKFLDFVGILSKFVVVVYADFLLEPEYRLTSKT
jgi:hypothetical protein